MRSHCYKLKLNAFKTPADYYHYYYCRCCCIYVWRHKTKNRLSFSLFHLDSSFQQKSLLLFSFHFEWRMSFSCILFLPLFHWLSLSLAKYIIFMCIICCCCCFLSSDRFIMFLFNHCCNVILSLNFDMHTRQTNNLFCYINLKSGPTSIIKYQVCVI